MRSQARMLTAACSAALLMVISGISAARPSQDADAELAGRLATVEPSSRRLSVLPVGEVKLVEVFAGDDCEVRQADRLLSLAELVVEVGRRVTVRYRMIDGRRVAHSISVELD